jgi:AraC family transcriptional regulator
MSETQTMRTTTLPDPNKADLNTACPEYGWPNFMNHAYCRSICYPEHWGPLSIKCVFQGREVYQSERIRYTVEPDSYLILNTGQLYSSSIATREETESFVVFFRPNFVEEVLTSLITSDDRLLDEPKRILGRPVTFFEGLHRHDCLISPMLSYLRTESQRETATPGWFEEQYHRLLERLLQAHRGVCTEIEALASKRLSTRVEIYRRLRRARDFIDADYRQKIRIEDMANAACMAPHHFLRLFKQAFGVTPHQYLTRRRLEVARKILTTSDVPVTQVCLDIGFDSLGSFSTLFTHRFGVSPRAFRQYKEEKEEYVRIVA